jgi:hypothetical protein
MVSFEIWTTGNNEPEGEWRVGDMHLDPLIRLRSLARVRTNRFCLPVAATLTSKYNYNQFARALLRLSDGANRR